MNENAREAKIDAPAITEAEVRTASKTFLGTIEAAVESGAEKAKQALAQIVRQLELEEKSDQFRVHLSIPELAADTHKEKAAEETSAAFFAVFRPLPEISGAKVG